MFALPAPRVFKLFLPFRFSNQNSVCISYIPTCKYTLKWLFLTPIASICSTMRRTTVEQKCGGGTWPIRAAVADDTDSPTPDDVVSPTTKACNNRIVPAVHAHATSFCVYYVT
jgi:hypothetical protein